MKYIELTKGKLAIVDDEDYYKVSQYKWSYSCRYAARWEGKGIHRKIIYMHKFIFGLEYSNIKVCHINKDPLDNRRENLRFYSTNQTQYYSTRPKKTTGYRGVYFNMGRWKAGIRVNGKQLHLGSFHDPITAALVHDAYVHFFHREYAQVNFPEVQKGEGLCIQQ